MYMTRLTRGTWEFAVLMFFDAVNIVSICGVVVISNLTVCDGDGVSSTSLAVMRCSLTFFAVLRCSNPPPTLMSPSKCIENWIDKIACTK